MTQDYEEKRTFFRMQIETEVSFSIKGENGSYSAVSQDLSASGLLMVSAKAPDIGSELDIEMSTSNPQLPPFVAEGKVLRVEANTPSPGQYLISVALTKIY
jgi:c-di-GMP-binding flagellar brake protein YcgR